MRLQVVVLPIAIRSAEAKFSLMNHPQCARCCYYVGISTMVSSPPIHCVLSDQALDVPAVRGRAQGTQNA